MNGITTFLGKAAESTQLGSVVISFVLAAVFFVLVAVLSTFPGGFMIAMAVIMIIAGVVALGFFFVSLSELFKRVSN